MLPERFQKLKKALLERQLDLTVIMDQVHKPHNMAAILRTSEAIGVHRAHIVKSPELAFRRPKSAAGVLTWIELDKHDNIESAYTAARAAGMRIIAAHPADNATHFRDYDYSQPTAIVLGTEKEGLSPYAIEQADELITIPMRGLVQSLNVSVSAALILYEAQRQRELNGAYEHCSFDEKTFKNILFEWSWPRIARYCQQQGIAYPEQDMQTGQIKDMSSFKTKVTSARQN